MTSDPSSLVLPDIHKSIDVDVDLPKPGTSAISPIKIN
jgi:hypothetical protein